MKTTYEIKFRVRQLESSPNTPLAPREIKVTMDGAENEMHTAYLYLSVTDEIPRLGDEFMATFQRLGRGVEQ